MNNVSSQRSTSHCSALATLSLDNVQERCGLFFPQSCMHSSYYKVGNPFQTFLHLHKWQFNAGEAGHISRCLRIHCQKGWYILQASACQSCFNTTSSGSATPPPVLAREKSLISTQYPDYHHSWCLCRAAEEMGRAKVNLWHFMFFKWHGGRRYF